MINLKKVILHKYKCIENDQSFEVDKDITVLVGMNESGKTAILEALAKTNYFEKDEKFILNTTHDYPRREKKRMEKLGERAKAITCEFEINSALLSKISEDIGTEVFEQNILRKETYYSGGDTVKNITSKNITSDYKKFIKHKTKALGISSTTLNDKLHKVSNKEELNELIEEYKDNTIKTSLESLGKYYENKWKWGNCLNEYIYREHISPNLPKYLYYDEYYALPSRISIEELESSQLDEDQSKTAKALFELAQIEISELVEADDFEDFKAELEATQAIITEELFEFWSTNQNLDIQFDIDKKEKADPEGNVTIVEHILDVRVKNNRTKVSLPLKNRSKGFNWFFSFLVWFKKIQEDRDSNYVILLDEPGLNLHASAQADLLKFIEKLSEDYQIIYTTHSPFMVDSRRLERVRTVVETENGSVISTSIQEKDPNTLFPLQAALGYDIAQNLYISKNNLLVEGVSDLIYLEIMSGILQQNNRTGLSKEITVIPVGGMDKVATFVSLLRGNKLDIACLLDSSIDRSSKSHIENLAREKLIQDKRVIFFDKFVKAKEADIEDLFEKEEYLDIFNSAFHEHENISISDLNSGIPRIVLQINKFLNIPRYNHYRPANFLARSGAESKDFSDNTLNRFEDMFKLINSLF